MIYVKDLAKSFGDNHVIKNINMHITPGEKVVIVGPSGSGKSTFLRCLNLLEQPTDGTITFDGQEITAPGVDVNKWLWGLAYAASRAGSCSNARISRNAR